MRILVGHNRYQQQGGEDVVVREEIALLEGAGHEVVQIQRDNRGIRRAGLWSDLRIGLETVWSRDSYNAVKRLIVATRPDIAHFHNTFPLLSPSVYYACRESGVPVVQTLHNYRLVCPRAICYRNGAPCELCVGRRVAWPGVRLRCYRGSALASGAVALMLSLHRAAGTWSSAVSAYVALTEFSRRKLVQGGLPEQRVHVKPNFLASDPGMRNGLGAYALYVGRLSEEKGVRTLLAAWSGIRDIPLRIVGAGPLEREVQSASTVANVHLRVGASRADVVREMRGARFLVVPSVWYECFPMTVVEALAVGVPIVASRIGSLPEFVREGISGVLFRPGDPGDLAAKAESLWKSTVDVQRLGVNARRQFESEYTANQNYRRLIDIYSRALQRGDHGSDAG